MPAPLVIIFGPRSSCVASKLSDQAIDFAGLELKLDRKLNRSGIRKSPVPLPSLSSILSGR